jgi:hypothetical protein
VRADVWMKLDIPCLYPTTIIMPNVPL